MKSLFHPSMDDVTVEGIMGALSDPVRIAIFRGRGGGRHFDQLLVFPPGS